MKLILAQGNPGAQYTSTRHNVGFMAIDSLAHAQAVAFTKKPKFHADIAELTVDGEKVLLVKPTTFYNETGQAARLLVDFYKLDATRDVLVVHDDLALPLGTIRTRQKGSDAGNNGIKSLSAHLGHAYHRIRVGIYSNLRDRLPDADFVLGTFNQAETEMLRQTIIPKVVELIDAFCRGNFDITSHSL